MNVEIVSDCNVEIFSNILKHFLSRSLIIFQHRIDNFLPVFEFEVSDALIQENPIDIREWGTRCSNTTSILPINSCKPVVFFIDHFFCKFISVFWKFWASWHNINQFSDKHGIVCYKKINKNTFFRIHRYQQKNESHLAFQTSDPYSQKVQLELFLSFQQLASQSQLKKGIGEITSYWNY